MVKGTAAASGFPRTVKDAGGAFEKRAAEEVEEQEEQKKPAEAGSRDGGVSAARGEAAQADAGRGDPAGCAAVTCVCLCELGCGYGRYGFR